MSAQQQYELIKIALLYIIGTGGIVTLLWKGFLKEFFDERKRIAKHKLNVARHVLKVCNEASTGNFKRPPRDIEHIHSVLTDVEGFNSDMEKTMTSFISLWQHVVHLSENRLKRAVNEKDFTKTLRDVEKKRKILVGWANKIRAGK
jgi:hypothetical protein